MEGTVTKAEYNQVKRQFGMRKSMVEDIFSATGTLKSEVERGITVVDNADGTATVYDGPQRTYWYDNNQNNTPISIVYTKVDGYWLVTSTDGYFA